MSIADSPKTTRCRVCGNPALDPAVDLGPQYLSSVFPTDLSYRDHMQRYPMDMVLCRTEGGAHCGLLQMGHHLDLTAMYQAYPYQSSTNSGMRAVLSDVAADGRRAVALSPGDVVLDIGCNDGTLLSMFTGQGLTLAGIDAAANIQLVFQDPALHHARGYFNRTRYDGFGIEKARLVFSIAMFYHLDDPVTFARDVAACLAPDGTWIIQMAYLPTMLDTNMYDNVVHEHAGYYGLESLQWVMNAAGLEIVDASLNDVYGGSYRVFVRHKSAANMPSARLAQLRVDERAKRLNDLSTWTAFADRIAQTRHDLITELDHHRKAGRTAWVYGASTKGNTILQYCGLTSAELPFAADSNPFKLGKFLIGSDVPIVDEAALRAARPDVLLALPYSFVDGFMARESDLMQHGTRFLVPLPHVHHRP
jgi:NDP-4-keto-2,6-dideoxyhexose 3-C-methyltransferase